MSSHWQNKLMIFNNLKNSFVSAAAFLVLAGTAVPLLAAPVKNIVLVHGAFVDGSGWKPAYDILVKDGYSVTVVQEPLTSLEEDVAATKRILDRQTGACILVGHSYGGAVITEAGNDSHVAGLVYIAAHAPKEGETEAANGKKFPNAAKPLVKTPDGFVFLDPGNFPADFAADLPREQAEFMAHSQMLTAVKVFTTPITNPAWKLKPSWYLVATADKTINPDLEGMYAERAPSHKGGAEGASHALYSSHAKEVAALIEEAADQSRVASLTSLDRSE